ncbi:MAG: hypothetical protein OXB97_14045 [Rhodospirillales bacterium]|nr:hypothetical protein [Rhodospirillales bacterium]
MAELALFRPAEALDADARLAGFIRHARDDLTVFGAGLDWDSPRWELRGVARVSGRGTAVIRVNWGHPLKKSAKSTPGYAPLDARNIDFFKAYLRYRYGLSPLMNPHQMLSAIRRLDQALSGAGKSILDVRPDDFNAAAATCRSDYSPESSYRVGQQLEAIAAFLDDHGLVGRSLVWTSPIRRPTHFHRIGAERERSRGRKLPSDRAIAALGEAYRRARHPMDVIAVSAYALLLVTHSRISELHRLDAYDCEVEVVENGKERYGLRWYPSKGGEPETRWIPSAFVPLARDTLTRIRDVTEPARALARRYMAGEEILPGDGPDDPLVRDGYIGMKTLGTITNPRAVIDLLRKNGFDVPCESAKGPGVPLVSDAGLYLRAPIEEGFRAELPQGFPLADPKSGLGYDRALLVRTADMTFKSSHVFWRLSCIQSKELEGTMNGEGNGTGRRAGLFRRLGLVDDDGETVRITPHQLRHYMTTLANEGNLSQLDIARWAGRKDVRHNAFYDHESADSLVSKARALGGDMFGSPMMATPQRPVTARQLIEGDLAGVHLTRYGACLHDFAASPCPMYRDCLNCVEHACVKGDERAERALRDRLAVIERAVASAEEAAAIGEGNSEIWLSRKRIELARLRELVALIDDTTLAPGAILRLNDAAHYGVGRDEGEPAKALSDLGPAPASSPRLRKP